MLGTVLILPIFLTEYELEGDLQSGAPEWVVIEGLVENPLNLTYAELWDFPLLSEVAMLECVFTGQGGGPSVTYNWTGVPLFYLLYMAKVIPGAYREVVFNATDGFSSSVLLETVMHPTTILALEANGTDLEQLGGFGSGYRVVLPCRWGYKWVKWVKQIIVVDYDYKGTYEQLGFSDEAIRPNCTMPSTDPPIQTFNATKLMYACDVNGDRKVRIDDILAVAMAFGSNCGEPKYEANLDITDDCKIRIDDILIAALNFGQGPW